MHIISNMWMLWIFGDNVEDRTGSVRFLVFYLPCGVLAEVVHVLFNADPTVPTIGASGAIAGGLGAYIVLYPAAQVIVFFPLFISWPIYDVLPAFLNLGIWFLMQFFNGSLSLLAQSKAGSVAWCAQIGGFIAGIPLHPLFVASPRPKRRGYIDQFGGRGAWPAFKGAIR